MQILFMHSLQELHQETLQTFGATLIYLFSVGFMKGGKESKELCSVFGLGFTSEWSVFKKLCILFYASARRRREEKSSASTILTRETS